MSTVAIAKKDILDSSRSRALWGVIGLFFAFVLLLTWLVVDDAGDTLGEAMGMTFVLGFLLFVPLTGLLISVKAIVRERESGTINLLLSLPHTRREMLLGKFIGRSVVMIIAVLVAFLPSLLYGAIQVDGIPIAEVAAILLATMLFGIMFVAIGVGFSALVNSETQATFGSIIVFILLYLWPTIIDLLGIELPTFANRFWLFNLYADILVTLLAPFEDDASATATTAADAEGILLEGMGVASPDIHMQAWFAFFLLAIWIAVPLIIGGVRFLRMDL